MNHQEADDNAKIILKYKINENRSYMRFILLGVLFLLFNRFLLSYCIFISNLNKDFFSQV